MGQVHLPSVGRCHVSGLLLVFSWSNAETHAEHGETSCQNHLERYPLVI